jgi:hypothetical protein
LGVEPCSWLVFSSSWSQDFGIVSISYDTNCSMLLSMSQSLELLVHVYVK